MKFVRLDLSKNPLGSNPVDNFFTVLQEQYPDDGITKDNANILSVYNYQDRYSETTARVEIAKNEAPLVKYIYYVKRFNLEQFIKNPLFTSVEINTVRAIENSFDLLKYIADKLNINLTEHDIFIEHGYIDYSGGTITPNWLMQSIESSLWFYGKINLWLHR